MKRVSISFIGLIACTVAIAAFQRDAVAVSMGFPQMRSESAGGSVSLSLARDDDDDAARAIARARLRDGEAGTYIQEILLERDSALSRWHDRPFQPLKVWVQSAPNIEDWNDDYVDAVATAFRTWDAVELPVRFRVVPDSADAEIHVTWIDRFNAPISGRTRWSRDDNWWIVNAGIVLAVHHQQGEVLDKSAMRAMALHEIGHLLGLDHTSDAASIMAAKVRVRDLSPIDKATVRLLYSVKAGPL
jgi:predicted Zn-dependent protease